MSAVATDTICFGDTSMSCTFSGGSRDVFFRVARDDLRPPLMRLFRIERRVGLRDDELVLAIGREDSLISVRHEAVRHHAIRRFDEAVLVDASEATRANR